MKIQSIFSSISYAARLLFGKAVFKMSLVLFAGVIVGLSSAEYIFHRDGGSDMQAASSAVNAPMGAPTSEEIWGQLVPTQSTSGDVVEVKKIDAGTGRGTAVQAVQQPVAVSGGQGAIPLPTRPAAPLVVQQLPVMQPQAAETGAAVQAVPLSTPTGQGEAVQKSTAGDGGQQNTESRIAFIGGNNAFTMK